MKYDIEAGNMVIEAFLELEKVAEKHLSKVSKLINKTLKEDKDADAMELVGALVFISILKSYHIFTKNKRVETEQTIERVKKK